MFYSCACQCLCPFCTVQLRGRGCHHCGHDAIACMQARALVATRQCACMSLSRSASRLRLRWRRRRGTATCRCAAAASRASYKRLEAFFVLTHKLKSFKIFPAQVSIDAVEVYTSSLCSVRSLPRNTRMRHMLVCRTDAAATMIRIQKCIMPYE